MKQRSSFSRRFISLVVGLIFIQGGYVIFAGSRIPSYMAFVIGSFFILNAIFDWLVPPRNAWLDIVATHAVFASGPLWVAVNVMLILICAITGYANRAAVELGGTLRLTLLCVALFVMIPATVVTTLYFSKCSHFRNPTWKEFPFRLNEPLQNLFLATWW